MKSKFKSIETALQTHCTHIAGITETDLEKDENIYIEGYRWIAKQRKHNKRRARIL